MAVQVPFLWNVAGHHRSALCSCLQSEMQYLHHHDLDLLCCWHACGIQVLGDIQVMKMRNNLAIIAFVALYILRLHKIVCITVSGHALPRLTWSSGGANGASFSSCWSTESQFTAAAQHTHEQKQHLHFHQRRRFAGACKRLQCVALVQNIMIVGSRPLPWGSPYRIV